MKSDGGWSLEMIDTHNPCGGANNWKASTNLAGGTPGAMNSVDGTNPDQQAPALLRAAAVDSVTLLLTFSEPVDLVQGGTPGNYAISEGVNAPAAAVVVSPGFSQVQLSLSTPIVANKVYVVSVNNLSDCSGNVINALNTARLVWQVLPTVPMW